MDTFFIYTSKLWITDYLGVKSWSRALVPLFQQQIDLTDLWRAHIFTLGNSSTIQKSTCLNVSLSIYMSHLPPLHHQTSAFFWNQIKFDLNNLRYNLLTQSTISLKLLCMHHGCNTVLALDFQTSWGEKLQLATTPPRTWRHRKQWYNEWMNDGWIDWWTESLIERSKCFFSKNLNKQYEFVKRPWKLKENVQPSWHVRRGETAGEMIRDCNEKNLS